MKISVIIAAYNAEKYLVETLQSVVNQTLDDYEIITINDGSKDGTLDILKEYEKEYPNFTVISKENGGVSAARNDGLNVAQGKYVYFYDADDILELEALEKMYEAAENNKAELVIAGYDMFDQYKTTEVKELNSLLELEKIDKYDTDILKTFSLTNKLFRRDIIEKYNLKDIDVLKVGHHGSGTSSSEEFINNIVPKYSIISVGKNNKYGHPNKEVLNRLENTKIYRTDKQGSIMFKIKNDKLKIETCVP